MQDSLGSCRVVSSHTLVSHDLAVQVVDLGVQLGDALITALALADLVVQIHAGQIEGIQRVLVLLQLDLVAVAVKDLNKADQEALKKIPSVLSVTPAA